MNLPTIKFAKTESLVLRCCRADMTSYGGFVWKKKGVVKAPDWKKNRDCRNGLHGWLSGQGHYDAWSASSDDLWSASSDDLWMVVAVKTKDIIDLNGKVKFPAARVLYVGKREIATGLIVAHCPASKVIYGTVTAGDYGIATAGEGGTATAGEGGILQINAWDSKALRYRIIIGYVGENGLVAGTQYKLDEHAQFVEVA